MIGLLDGTVTDGCVLTAAGVGYQVHCPFDLPEGEQVRLLIRHVQSEAGDTLYGFTDHTHRQVFDALVKVTGVAGKTALALLRDLGMAGLAGAVTAGDAKALTAAKGVGAKLAAKIVAMAELPDGLPAAGDGGPAGDGDLVLALAALGYPDERARELARTATAKTAGLDVGVDEQLKVALADARS